MYSLLQNFQMEDLGDILDQLQVELFLDQKLSNKGYQSCNYSLSHYGIGVTPPPSKSGSLLSLSQNHRSP